MDGDRLGRLFHASGIDQDYFVLETEGATRAGVTMIPWTSTTSISPQRFRRYLDPSNIHAITGRWSEL